MDSQRIVLVMVDPPLPFGKAMGRWYSVLLKGLVERGHRVEALATCQTREEGERAEALFPAPGFRLKCYPHGTSTGLKGKWDTLRRPYSYTFGEAFLTDLRRAMAGGFDLLHLETLWSGWYGLGHRDRAVVTVPWLYQIDLADQPPGSLRDAALRRLTFAAERRLLRGYPNLVAVSPRLADRMRTVSPGSKVHVLPFGMDPERYPLLEPAPVPRPPTAGLIASFNWTPGYNAGKRILDRIWPGVSQRLPNARLVLAGVGARSAFADAVGRPGVTVEDRVTDVPAFFRSIDVLLYPPNDSSGMKFKVLEAFGFGVPVVTNAAGVEGIPAEDGVHAGVCPDDAGLIDRTVGLLTDPARRERVRRAARALFLEHCGPDAILDRLEAIYQDVLERSGVPLMPPSG
jgi:glycosyltransferase involved in cell wall biosynthesis